VRLPAAPRRDRGRAIFQGTVKSASPSAPCFWRGHRRHDPGLAVGPPVEEVKVGISILESLGMRQRRLEMFPARPAAAQVDVYKLARR